MHACQAPVVTGSAQDHAQSSGESQDAKAKFALVHAGKAPQRAGPARGDVDGARDALSSENQRHFSAPPHQQVHAYTRPLGVYIARLHTMSTY